MRNAYATSPPHRDSRWKRRIMPDAAVEGHPSGAKAETRRGTGMRPISLLAGRRPTKATMGRGSERTVPHTGTETRSRLLREAAVGDIGQWAEA